MRPALPIRLTRPLPTSTSIVLACLVALAATLSDGAVAMRSSTEGSVAWRVAASSRLVAAALSTVADRLADDWTANGWRLRPNSTFAHLTISGSDHDSHARSALGRSSFASHDNRLALAPIAQRLVRLSNNVPPPDEQFIRA